ncbi:hypothetical protein BpHYR1_044198 [Brachionus plicatilis]|uniref:Uncharacterized protein n=1 Tax=Brachionus plicatilis TaxID=10195 RepID=A0A3M7PAZ8_BRAPC|nr:hypothetical protein BpHYR1_044198 [Brachionus plicatilis]
MEHPFIYEYKLDITFQINLPFFIVFVDFFVFKSLSVKKKTYEIMKNYKNSILKITVRLITKNDLLAAHKWNMRGKTIQHLGEYKMEVAMTTQFYDFYNLLKKNRRQILIIKADKKKFMSLFYPIPSALISFSSTFMSNSSDIQRFLHRVDHLQHRVLNPRSYVCMNNTLTIRLYGLLLNQNMQLLDMSCQWKNKIISYNLLTNIFNR